MDRRSLLAWLALASWARPAWAQDRLAYRGFYVDTSVLADLPRGSGFMTVYNVVEALKRQLDIVADSGVSPAVMAYFRAQPITLRKALPQDGTWRFTARTGLELVPGLWAATNPMVLHGLLAGYMGTLPAAAKAQIAHFYDQAKQIAAAPSAFPYLGTGPLKSAGNFFGQTASLYLYGTAEISPFQRAVLEQKQPDYCAWLADTFGVRK